VTLLAPQPGKRFMTARRMDGFRNINGF
jgi:hypothetical protein